MQNQAVLAYDIVDNKTRRKAFKRLQAWQIGSQYSVFECRLNKRQSEELLLQLCNIIDEQQDKLLFVWLDSRRPAKALTKRAQIQFQTPAWYIG
ncbi:CRISPR-associated endonuclease Cas2 [Methylotuvimicrobium sp. KM2]|uniref:CRISPR-associated endonuclease Cas2 n=1 Tax=Methylotuvimicrobium sp. KM2 TaxID=3133976 RepID=UPI0031012579